VDKLPWHGKKATNIRTLLAETPGGKVSGAQFGPKYAARFHEPLFDRDLGEKLLDVLLRAEAGGSCVTEKRPSPAGGHHPPLLFVHAVAAGVVAPAPAAPPAVPRDVCRHFVVSVGYSNGIWKLMMFTLFLAIALRSTIGITGGTSHSLK